MLRSEPRDDVYFEHELTAGQLLARFSGVRGPDLRDPVSVHKRRPLASWGLPTHARWRTLRRELSSGQPAPVIAVGALKRQIGVTTAWFANAPPAQSGA
jgi:hypothetical protein